MKKRQWIITYLSIIIILFIFYSMAQSHYSVSTIPDEGKDLFQEEPLLLTPYQLWIEDKDYSLSLYEPKEGCYAGAYILSNKEINFDIYEFENKTKKPHSIYIRNMKLGEPFPLDWVLECYSYMKTPHIIIHPPSESFPYQEHLLEQTAKEFGEFFIPMFVQFYPNPSQYFGNHIQYQDFFQKAYYAFKTNAPNVSIIWSIAYENLYDSYLYDPGDTYFDWIGLNMYLPSKIEEEKKGETILQYIHDFYMIYQCRKPLMISQLGVPHYSKKDHRYYIKEAKQTLNSIYNAVEARYPRIKAIHYMDINNVETNPSYANWENFSITEEMEVLHTYQKLIKSPHYLEELDVKHTGDVQSRWILMDTPVYSLQQGFYISNVFLKYPYFKDLYPKFNNTTVEPLIIKDQTLYSLENICDVIGYQFKIDEINKQIYLTLNRS